MTAVEYLARIAVTGTVMGLGLGSSADEIRTTLGGSCVEDRRRKSLRLDFGLLEFSLFDGFCEGVAIQVHRLAAGPERVVPEVLKTSLSGLPQTISLVDIRADIEADGIHLLEESRSQSGFRTFAVRHSPATLYVLDSAPDVDASPAPGDLWAIMLSRLR